MRPTSCSPTLPPSRRPDAKASRRSSASWSRTPSSRATARASRWASSTRRRKVSQAKETGQVAATIVFENIQNMWSRMFARSRAKRGVAHQPGRRAAALDGMSARRSAPAASPSICRPAVSGVSLRGPDRPPVIPVEYCAALGTEGDIILCDPQPVRDDRQGLDPAGLEHPRALPQRRDDLSASSTVATVSRPGTRRSRRSRARSPSRPFVTLATRA
jgi:hypothetical protein